MKYIIVIGDGMADNPVPDLGGKTPLEYARIPMMDTLASVGELGSVRTVPEGVPPGSDTAILSIFGYDPRVYYTGRSPLEAAGCGVELAAGDVSYRCNMVAYEDGDMPFHEKRILSHNGGSIDGESSIALLAFLLADPGFAALADRNHMVFYPSPSFRHIAVQKGADIRGLVAAPPHDHPGEVIGGLLPAGCPTAAGLVEMMALAHALLDCHPINNARRAEGKLPANGIWFWAEGQAVMLPSFYEKYRMAGFVLSAVPLIWGIGALAGLQYRTVPGATGELDTDFEGKAAGVLEGLGSGESEAVPRSGVGDAALGNGTSEAVSSSGAGSDRLGIGADFAVLHVEAPDECTHNGDLDGKLEAIRRLDSRIVAPLAAKLRAAGGEFRILMLADHKTLTATRNHDGGPVPYVLYDSR
ncbi:MAG: hypothetical protein FWF83_04710, partial [Clostridiales bacterium]|nr:hypothetical protein [Clostridiales bacterium]